MFFPPSLNRLLFPVLFLPPYPPPSPHFPPPPPAAFLNKALRCLRVWAPLIPPTSSLSPRHVLRLIHRLDMYLLHCLPSDAPPLRKHFHKSPKVFKGGAWHKGNEASDSGADGTGSSMESPQQCLSRVERLKGASVLAGWPSYCVAQMLEADGYVEAGRRGCVGAGQNRAVPGVGLCSAAIKRIRVCTHTRGQDCTCE